MEKYREIGGKIWEMMVRYMEVMGNVWKDLEHMGNNMEKDGRCGKMMENSMTLHLKWSCFSPKMVAFCMVFLCFPMGQSPSLPVTQPFESDFLQ